MSTHNVCFYGEIKKIFTWYPSLLELCIYLNGYYHITCLVKFRWYMRATKWENVPSDMCTQTETRISLYFWPVWSESSLSAQKKNCILCYPKCAQQRFWSECAKLHWLIWIFAGGVWPKVHCLTYWVILCFLILCFLLCWKANIVYWSSLKIHYHNRTALLFLYMILYIYAIHKMLIFRKQRTIYEVSYMKTLRHIRTIQICCLVLSCLWWVMTRGNRIQALVEFEESRLYTMQIQKDILPKCSQTYAWMYNQMKGQAVDTLTPNGQLSWSQ